MELTLDDNGHPLDAGRRARRVPPRLRLALEHRDWSCRFPGCADAIWTDAHHVTHWAHGGPTDLDNLVLPCRRHHVLLHEGGFTVDHDHVFRAPSGRAIPRRPTPPPGSPDEVQLAGVTPDTIRTQWDGQPLDLDLALTALLHPERAAFS